MRQRGQNENQIGIYGPSDQETPTIRMRGRNHGARGGCTMGSGCGVKNAPVEKNINISMYRNSSNSVNRTRNTMVTPPRMARINLNSWSNYFWLKNDCEKWSRFFFEILCAHLEILANLPSQFSCSGDIFLHWATKQLKGHVVFQKKNFQHHS